MPLPRLLQVLSSSNRKAARLARAETLVATSRFDEADRLLSSSIAREPDDLGLWLHYAYSAHNSARYGEALARWTHVRSAWPEVAMGWSACACNLRELDRLEEARSVIDQALQRFPTDLVAISEAIRIFERSGDIARGLALGAELMRLDPEQPTWRKQQFERLVAQQRFDEAADLVAGAGDAGGHEAPLAFGRVLIALRRGDVAAAEAWLAAYAKPGEADPERSDAIRTVALERKLHHPEESRILWAHLVRVDPNDASILHHHADTLIRCGRYDEAGRAIVEALDRHPDHDDLRVDRALLALKTERWDAAIEGFEAQLRRRPHDEDASNYLARARMERAQALLEAAAASAQGATIEMPSIHAPSAAERQDVGLVDDDDTRRLLLGFESLGQDCEFGLLQRRYGAEPLGLFRWNSCNTDRLVQASDVAFAGMGEPEHTLMQLWADYEYYLADRRWGFAFHTWISRHEVDRDQLFAKMCRRIGFLRTKLLDDLASGDKIFVHKTFEMELDDVRRLLASLRAHGPVRLLWVRSLDLTPHAEGRAGTVEEIEPGLYAGFVAKFGNAPRTWQILFEDWVRVCRAAAAIARAA